MYNLISIFEGHDKQIFSVAIDPSGSIVVTAGRDKKLKFWKIEEDKLELINTIVT